MNKMSFEPFPMEILVPKEASISRSGDTFDIRIDLQPFVLDDEAVETAFHLDRAWLPADTRTWANQSFIFPRNPKDG